MGLLVANIQWVMLAAGLLTLTMLQAVVAPKAAARAFFGEALDGPAADVIVRNWAFLIVLSALFLLYAAFVEPAFRAPAVAFSSAGKLCFVVLVLRHRKRFAGRQALIAAGIDSVFVALFAAYLIGVALQGSAAPA